MKKIFYIGSIDEHVALLKNEISRSLLGCEFIVEQKAELSSAYAGLVKHRPAIILMSYSAQEALTRKFFIMTRKVFGKLPFVILAPTKESVVAVPKLSTLGDYIYWLKNPTFNEVIEYLSKKLEIKVTQSEKLKAFFKDDFDLFHSMKVVHLGRNYAKVETNRYYENDTKLTLQFPYHLELLNSNQHKVIKRSTSSTESHLNYSYELEYILHTKKLDVSARSRLLKDYKYEISTKPVNEKAYAALIEATKEKKFILAEDKIKPKIISEDTAELNELDLLSRTLYFNWILEQNEAGYKTKDTITFYDGSCQFLKNGFEEIEKDFVNVIPRMYLGKYQEDMLSDVPSLLVINLDENNTIDKVKEMIAQVTLLKDHFPFVVLFNYKGNLSADDLRHHLEYHFILSSPEGSDIYLVKRMLEIYRRKKREKEIKKAEKRLAALRKEDPGFYRFDEHLLLDYKVYKEFDDPTSIIITSSPAQTIWMSETELMFKSHLNIEPGEIFRIRKPFDLQIEVLSKEKDQNSEGMTGYLCHIHFLTETDKIAIQGFVKEVSELNKQNVFLYLEDIEKMKNKYFPFNFIYDL